MADKYVLKLKDEVSEVLTNIAKNDTEIRQLLKNNNELLSKIVKASIEVIPVEDITFAEDDREG